MANWDKRFMDMARHVAAWSKDKNTKLGAVIVDDENTILSIGYNGFPRGSNDNIEERYERPQKYLYTEHAERNAIYNAVRHGVSLKGSTIYVPMFPCVDCARGIINSGIKTVVTYEPNFYDEKWGDSFKVSHQLFEECGVEIKIFSDENDWFYNHFKSVYDEKKEVAGKVYGALEWDAKGAGLLLTKINMASMIILQGNLKYGANRIRCNEKNFCFVKQCTNSFYEVYYEVSIDHEVPEGEIIVYYDGRDGFTGKEEKFNYILIKMSNYF